MDYSYVCFMYFYHRVFWGLWWGCCRKCGWKRHDGVDSDSVMDRREEKWKDTAGVIEGRLGYFSVKMHGRGGKRRVRDREGLEEEEVVYSVC